MNLKLMLAGLAVAGAATATVNAQVKVGAKGGLNYSIYGTKIDPEPDEKPENGTGVGFHLGGYAEIELSDVLAFRPELLFSMRNQQAGFTDGTTFTDPTGTIFTATVFEGDATQTLSYLEVPLLLAYKPNESLGIHFGPGLGLLVGAKEKSDGTSTTTISNTSPPPTVTITSSNFASEDTSTDRYRGVEIGLAAGIAYEVESGLNFGLRYWRGLTSLYEDLEAGGATFKTHANVIQFSVGYTFIKN